MDASAFINDVENAISDLGIPITYTAFTKVYTSGDYDEFTSLVSGVTYSGTAIVSTVGKTSMDYKWMEQGILTTRDIAIYTTGSLSMQSDMKFTLLGSTWSVVQNGIIPFAINGSTVYNKVYLKLLVGGKMYGEA